MGDIKFTKEQSDYLEEIFALPCCHVSGMHNPTHFQKRKYICDIQCREAFKEGCKRLGINPKTYSRKNCGWCNDYPEKKKGEGLKLFQKKEN